MMLQGLVPKALTERQKEARPGEVRVQNPSLLPFPVETPAPGMYKHN